VKNVRSTLKTTAAVLRSIIGEKDSDWAKMLGKSIHTIRHLEAGSLELSPAMAARMNYQTGISVRWLLDCDPAAPAVSAGGRDYTKEIFEEVQAEKKSFAYVEVNAVKIDAIEFLRRICNILVTANRKRCYHLTAYRIGKALDEWSAQLGEPRDFNTYEKVRAYVQDVLARKEPGLPLVPPPEHARNIWEGLGKLAQAQDKPTPKPKPKSKQPSTKRRRR
jgi:hypothetical protein